MFIIISIEIIRGFNRTVLVTWRLKKGQSVDLSHGRRQIVEAKRDVEFSTNLEVKPSLTYLSAIKLNFSTFSFGIMETWLRCNCSVNIFVYRHVQIVLIKLRHMYSPNEESNSTSKILDFHLRKRISNPTKFGTHLKFVKIVHCVSFSLR